MRKKEEESKGVRIEGGGDILLFLKEMKKTDWVQLSI